MLSLLLRNVKEKHMMKLAKSVSQKSFQGHFLKPFEHNKDQRRNIFKKSLRTNREAIPLRDFAELFYASSVVAMSSLGPLKWKLGGKSFLCLVVTDLSKYTAGFREAILWFSH